MEGYGPGTEEAPLSNVAHDSNQIMEPTRPDAIQIMGVYAPPFRYRMQQLMQNLQQLMQQLMQQMQQLMQQLMQQMQQLVYQHHSCISIAFASLLRQCCIMLHHCCITAASLLHHCCITVASLLHNCCITVASLLHHRCITVASPLRHRANSLRRVSPYVKLK
jgi:ABC-type proline/glycine betaine transport system permease subunit